MDRIIEVQGLKKSFGKISAVKKLDFYVEEGTLFAFLGPNGAGKSTTIDMITTQLQPDQGEVSINGFHLGKQNDRIRASIGIVFQDSLLDPFLTVEENLMTRGSFYGLSRHALKSAVSRAVEATSVADFLKRPYGKLSGGQRRRADIARALIHTPAILFLDEPTTGLDPQTRLNVWETIRQLQYELGTTIFLTTHYMEEAAQADYITLIDHGELLAKGTPPELKEQYATDRLLIVPHDKETLESVFQTNAIPYTIASGAYHIELKHTVDALTIIDDCRSNIARVEINSGTMDDVFVKLTGKGVRSE